MAKLPDGRVETVHIQTGDFVYIYETDEILPNDENLLDKVAGLKELAGSAQGDGIETIWWDGSNEPIVTNIPPEDLRFMANTVRSLESKEAKPTVKLIYKP